MLHTQLPGRCKERHTLAFAPRIMRTGLWRKVILPKMDTKTLKIS